MMRVGASQLQTHSDVGLDSRMARLRTRAAGRLRLGLHSRSTRYGLRRDLQAQIEKPSAKIPIAVRPMAPGDVESLLGEDPAGPNLQERLEIAWRRAFIEKGARGGFVAVDERDGSPCYMQWLMSAAENPFIRRLGGFPGLKADEALLENAYTPVNYRGMGIMSAAMALIAERAADFGARYVLTFVDETNIASLKGCQRAGFHPHLLHHKEQRAFGIIKRDSFEVLAQDDPRRTRRF